MMNDIAVATLYGVLDGEIYPSASAEYSVITYANSTLPKSTTTAKVKTLIVDLLNYGAAAQIYGEYKQDTLANAGLTAEQLALGTQGDLRATVTHQNLTYKVIDAPAAAWKGASLRLESAVTIRYTIETVDLTDVKAVITLNGKTYEIPSSEFVPATKANQYYIYFDKATASQMSMPVLATIVKGDQEISNTVQYSIESYVNTNRGKGTALSNLVEAMMKYADSAAAYAGR